MFNFESQTPTIYETPSTIYYNYDNSQYCNLKGEISQIGNVLYSLQNNAYADFHPTPAMKTELKLDDLYNQIADWHGRNVDAPDPESISRARKWIKSMYADAAKSNGTWMDPHVSSNEDGNVTFEWWNGQKKLTVYVSTDESWYIRVWGADVINEMSDGTAESSEEREDAWRWLMS